MDERSTLIEEVRQLRAELAELRSLVQAEKAINSRAILLQERWIAVDGPALEPSSSINCPLGSA